MSRIAGALGTTSALLLLLVGCASTVPVSTAPDASSPTSSPTPTAACPQLEGAELPPECAPYDPDHAMAQNDVYRERMELSADAAAAAEVAAAPVAAALERVRASGTITQAAVERAIEDAGLTGPQVRESAGDVLFGVAGPDGGCVYGAVTAEAVQIEVGGYIMDGGCLPAQ